MMGTHVLIGDTDGPDLPSFLAVKKSFVCLETKGFAREGVMDEEEIDVICWPGMNTSDLDRERCVQETYQIRTFSRIRRHPSKSYHTRESVRHTSRLRSQEPVRGKSAGFD